jgi:hypothetical protein
MEPPRPIALVCICGRPTIIGYAGRRLGYMTPYTTLADFWTLLPAWVQSVGCGGGTLALLLSVAFLAQWVGN